MELVDDPLKKELVESGHVLSRINKDIKQKKTTNTMLIKQGIMAVEGNIRFILKALGKEDLIKDIYYPFADYSRDGYGIAMNNEFFVENEFKFYIYLSPGRSPC